MRLERSEGRPEPPGPVRAEVLRPARPGVLGGDRRVRRGPRAAHLLRGPLPSSEGPAGAAAPADPREQPAPQPLEQPPLAPPGPRAPGHPGRPVPPPVCAAGLGYGDRPTPSECQPGPPDGDTPAAVGDGVIHSF